MATSLPPASLHAFLADPAGAGAACPACGGVLRDCTSDRCPHCNVPLTLALDSPDAYRRAWGIALALTTIDAAVGGLILAMTLTHGLPHRPLLVGAFSFMALVPAPLLLLVFRRRMLRMRAALQRTLLVAAAVATIWSFLSLFVGFS